MNILRINPLLLFMYYSFYFILFILAHINFLPIYSKFINSRRSVEQSISFPLYQSTLLSSSSLLFFQDSVQLTSSQFKASYLYLISFHFSPILIYSFPSILFTHHDPGIHRAHQSKPYRLCLELAFCILLLFFA